MYPEFNLIIKKRTADSISYNNLLQFYRLSIFGTKLKLSEVGGKMKNKITPKPYFFNT
jgi:hypothetical protein